MDVGGGSNACHVVFVSNDASPPRFLPEGAEYRQLAGHLDRPGQVGFRLKNGKMTVRSGTVGVAVGGDRTKIKVNVHP